ncbi:hypothetical protein ACFO0N_06415 [Halobium salinum]|uniref:Uncharacterized protein n=1 Tax=Halobium salinum TaxID=1364940 RepID=A0ABD5PA30_9EURY|nr:hypothetical protein [Halobium salinum]
MKAIVEQLGGAELGERIRLTLADGTTVEGLAGPVEYVPGRRVRVELRGDGERYDASAACEDRKWDPVEARRVAEGGTDPTWDVLGMVESVETEFDGPGRDARPNRHRPVSGGHF